MRTHTLSFISVRLPRIAFTYAAPPPLPVSTRCFEKGPGTSLQHHFVRIILLAFTSHTSFFLLCASCAASFPRAYIFLDVFADCAFFFFFFKMLTALSQTWRARLGVIQFCQQTIQWIEPLPSKSQEVKWLHGYHPDVRQIETHRRLNRTLFRLRRPEKTKI